MIPIIEYLIQCDHAYYNGLEPLVSDYEYDVMKTEAKEDDPNNPYFSSIGAPIDGEKVDLPHILGSLDKMKYDGSMNEWVQNTGVIEIAVSDKLDGCTIYAKYVDGKLVQATTRGDGYVGRDITDKAKIFCPSCKEMGVVELKGEVLATHKTAIELGYKKSRTFVAGELNRPEIKHSKHLSVVFYHVLNKEFVTYEGHLDYITDIDLPVVDCVRLSAVGHPESLEDVLASYYKERKEDSMWDLDGLVIIDNLDGNHTDEYYPTNACAYKIDEDAIPTVVREVTWEVKRSGKLQPIVYIEPVEISGSTVTKATGFNAAFIRDNDIMPGKPIGVVLAGEIIPYLYPID